jgi:uncharacterized protein YcaQ
MKSKKNLNLKIAIKRMSIKYERKKNKGWWNWKKNQIKKLSQIKKTTIKIIYIKFNRQNKLKEDQIEKKKSLILKNELK